MEKSKLESYLPQWVIDLASVSSVFGLMLTIVVVYYTRSIRNSFLRRARLPEIIKELETNISEVSSGLKNLTNDKKHVLEAFAKSKGLLQNLQPKLPVQEKKQIEEFLSKLQPRNFFFIKGNLSEITEDRGWDLYIDLNTIFAQLTELAKDSRWD